MFKFITDFFPICKEGYRFYLVIMSESTKPIRETTDPSRKMNRKRKAKAKPTRKKKKGLTAEEYTRIRSERIVPTVIQHVVLSNKSIPEWITYKKYI